MSDANRKNTETEVMTAIAAFEQILEAMPDDRASLDALAHAYEQIGDHTRARDYLVRLGEIMLDEGDFASARDLLDRLKKYADEDPRASDLVDEISSKVSAPSDSIMTAQVSAEEAAIQRQAAGQAVRSSFNMADELSFAWSLMESNKLTQEEYSSVVQDLTEMSSSESNGATISVMHVLEAKGFKGLESVLSFISEESGSPIVSLSSFDLRMESVMILPLDFMRQRGAVVYEMLGKDVLVAVMNPFDKQLRKDIETVSGRVCHFYVCTPSEFDGSINKASEMLAAAAEAAAE